MIIIVYKYYSIYNQNFQNHLLNLIEVFFNGKKYIYFTRIFF